MQGEASNSREGTGAVREREQAPRITLAALVLLLVTGLAVGTSQGGPPPNPLKAAELSQKGRKLILEVKTRPEVAVSSFQRFPDIDQPSSAYLCAEFDSAKGGSTRRICIGGEKDRKRFVGLSLVAPSGKVSGEQAVPATVLRETPHRITVALVPGDAGLRPGSYRWRAIYSDGECAEDAVSCGYALPEQSRARYRIRQVDPVGCTGGNGQVVRSGPSAGRRVALTFDDGPSSYTRQILSILERFRAKATFFVVGSMVRSDPGTARRIVAEGHEIANHSYSHPMLPSRSELVSTNGAIRKTTRFRPCLFRPPYGALDSRLARDSGAERMKTILWNVDTVDWRTPGSGSIASVGGGARAGSIVLMHDGGGPRGQTVAALPSIISSLKGRGLKPVTVSKLLGNRTIWRPR
ncbi:MAG: polysaccharide deacetylase family protein [Solirubrobacterales bacterium]